jgi:quinol monooxygenase YgiN
VVRAHPTVPASIHRCRSTTKGLDVSDELVILARFHAIDGNESAVAAELRETATRTRAEPGCLFIEVYRSLRDPRQFFLNSRWRDEAAFDVHADLPVTRGFVERTQRLIDHPFDVTRAKAL